MKLILRGIKPEDWQAAVTVALDWNKWHNTPGHDKHTTIMAGRFVVHRFVVHETASGTVVVRYK